MSAAPRILAVCTGNISRSPAVERLLRAGLGDSALVTSAGVGAVVGAPVDPPVAAWLAERGVGVDGFAARQLTAPMIAEADLVLALTREHRARVLDSVEGTVDGTTPGERLLALLPRVSAGRALAPRRPPVEDDVRDPYRGSAAVYSRSLAEIEAAIGTILARVR